MKNILFSFFLISFVSQGQAASPKISQDTINRAERPIFERQNEMQNKKRQSLTQYCARPTYIYKNGQYVVGNEGHCETGGVTSSNQEKRSHIVKKGPQ